MLTRARQGACSSLPAPVGGTGATNCTLSQLAHVYDEKSCVVTCGGLEHVEHTDVHEDPTSPGVAETDLDALRGTRLFHDQGDKKEEEGQIFFVYQLEGVFPEELLVKVAEKSSTGRVRAGRPGPGAHVAQA